MCGKFCGLFIARRFQLLRVCCQKKKKNKEKEKETAAERETDRLKTEQKDNSSMRKQSKIESCTHKVPQPQHSPLALFLATGGVGGGGSSRRVCLSL